MDSFGVFLVIPTLSIYLYELVHLSHQQVGISISVLFLSSNLSMIPLGRAADYSNPRKLLCIGTFLRALGYFLVASASIDLIGLVYFGLILVGVGTAFISPTIAKMISSCEGNSEEKFRKRSISYSFGMLTALILASSMKMISIKCLYLLSSLVFIFATFYAFGVLKKITIATTSKETENASDGSSIYKEILLKNRYNYISLILYSSVYSQLFYMIPIVLSESDLSESFLFIIYIVNCLFYIFIQPIWMRRFRGIGLYRTITISTISYFVGYLILDLYISPMTMVIFAILYSYAGSILDPLFLANLETNNNSDAMGRLSSVSFLCRGVGLLLGNILGFVVIKYSFYGFEMYPLYFILIMLFFISNIKNREQSNKLIEES